jgi:anti-sigma B factor antagonist
VMALFEEPDPDIGEFDIQVSRTDEAATVLTILGDVDVAAAMRLSSAISSHTAAGPPLLVVDLSEVELLSSAGIAVLLGSTKRATPTTRFRIVATSDVVLQPIDVLGLKSILPIYPSVDEALAA